MKWLRRALPSRAHGVALGAFLSAGGLLFVAPWAAALPLALFVALCAAAPFFPTWAFFLPALSHGDRRRREVAITFDDGPDPRTSAALLALLAAEGVPATFFVVGRRAAAHPEALRAIWRGGHVIGNHSYSHDPWLMLRSTTRLRREIAACQGELSKQGGVEAAPRWFRPPVGITNPRLGPVLDELGLRCVMFSCRPLDFGNRRLAGLSARVLARVRPGDVILLHDALPAERAVATWLEELRAIVRGLRARDLAIVPLEQMLPPRSSAAPFTPARSAAIESHAHDADLEARSGRVSAVLQAALLVTYPLLAFGGLELFGTQGAAWTLFGLVVATKWRALWNARAGVRSTGGLWLGVMALLLSSAFLDDARFMLAYPSLVSGVLFAQFFASLWRGPPMAERFARLQVQDLHEGEIRYCRAVTRIWCVFFLLNGGAAASLAYAAPRAWWAFYTGLLSYGLVGGLFAVEYVVRKARFGRFSTGPVDRALVRCLRWAGRSVP